MARRFVVSSQEAFAFFKERVNENPSRSRALIVYPDYANMPSASSRDAFIRAMWEAEQADAVRLTWGRRAHAEFIEAVRLVDIDRLYELLGWERPGLALPCPAEIAMLRVAPQDEPLEPWLALARHLDGRVTPGEISRLVAEFLRIRDDRRNAYAFIVAAGGDFASSKILDRIPGALLRGVGIDSDRFRRHPTVLLTSGAANPDAVVLVENPLAFERAWSATCDLPVAWVSTHGLVATSLERGIDDIACAVAAVRSGNPPPLDSLLAHRNLLYWGDLDKFGLWIFHRVRVQLPGIQLSALYRPMADLLNRGGGHAYCTLVEKAGQQDWDCSDPQVDGLLRLCCERAVDQEWVDEAEIRRGCLHPYGAMKAGPILATIR